MDKDNNKHKSSETNSRRDFIKKIAITGGAIIASPLLRFCGNDDQQTDDNGKDTDYEPTLYDIPDDGKSIEYAGDQLIITREANTVYALLSVCTHQQCIVNYFPSEKRFICPCHAAMYNPDGTKIQGPQPRGLGRYKIKLHGKSKVEVDTRQAYTENDPEYKNAYITLP
jgi:nitrite reductase/ring-hydroxylating ferredoxin subunit